MPRETLGIALAALVALTPGCGEKIDAVQPTACSAPGSTTYTGQIKAILDTLCTDCHSSALSGSARNGAPPAVNFDTYEAAVKLADQANTRLQNESMPPGGTKASPAQKEQFACWVASGGGEGP